MKSLAGEVEGPGPRVAGLSIETKRARDQWVDAAKGITIILVVLHHVCEGLATAGGDLSRWISVDAVLTWVRMPVFFLLAGLFAARAVEGSSICLWRDRVFRFVYIFALWSLLYLPFYAVEALFEGRSVMAEIQTRSEQLVIAVSPMWFVLALAGFFAIARIIRSVWVSLQLALAGALSVCIVVFGAQYPFEKLWLLFFFLFGCHLSKCIRTAMKRIGADRVAGAKVFGPVRWVGSNTLPICLLHVLVLSIVVQFRGLLILGDMAPVLVTAITVVGALGAWSVLRRIPGLFELPRYVTSP